ncbi:MAG: ribonuclease HI [Acidobacteriia bacterium]|nr:ribonuclease HI [Terriglobia bacterium]
MVPKEVTIYTDGACLGNPGPGGYGVVLLYGSHRKELSGGFRVTTNNRMEILAAVVALEALKEKCRVILYSDSQYLVNAMQQGWAMRWRANNWRRNKNEMALNPDLWDRLLGCTERHKVEFRWLRGHAGDRENERCDQLAMAAANAVNRAIDFGYEKTLPQHARGPGSA